MAKVPREKTVEVKKKDDDKAVKPKRGGVLRPFRSIGGYFAGAWQELRQVRWPNRSATWGLTLAVILFSAFFAALILGLDAGWGYVTKILFRS